MVSKKDLNNLKDLAVNTEDVIFGLFDQYARTPSAFNKFLREEWVTKKLVSKYKIDKTWARELYLEFK